MKKTNQILIAIGVIALGFSLNSIAWSEKIGHPISTICLLSGLALFFGGIVFLITIITRK